MRTGADNLTCDVPSALAQLAELLADASCEVEAIEVALTDWLANGAESVEFPVVELQRLDLVRQIQADVTSVLLSEHISSDAQGSVDLETLIPRLKLERVKSRLLQSCDAGHGTGSAGGSAAAASGNLDLL